MPLRSALALSVCAVLCCLVLAVAFGPPAGAQQAFTTGVASNTVRGPAVPTVAGRYQAVATHGGSSPFVVVLDTATGQCWSRQAIGTAPWQDLKSPAARGDK